MIKIVEMNNSETSGILKVENFFLVQSPVGKERVSVVNAGEKHSLEKSDKMR